MTRHLSRLLSSFLLTFNNTRTLQRPLPKFSLSLISNCDGATSSTIQPTLSSPPSPSSHLFLPVSMMDSNDNGDSPQESQSQKKNQQELQNETPSFYRRKLPPSTCVGFASPNGKRIFQSALQNNGLKSFYNLIQQYHTQTEPAYCGVSTLVMVLNTLAVDPHRHWKGPWRWYEERMLNCCVDLNTIKETGITLKDFQCLALCQGLSVDLEYVYPDSDDDHQREEQDIGLSVDSEHVDSDSVHSDRDKEQRVQQQGGLEQFRRAVRAACIEEPSTTLMEEEEYDEEEGMGDSNEDSPISVLVVSYNRKTLKQTGTGHFSPIAAYDSVSDSVLILDTARFKYGAHWTKLPLIYEAMKSIDPASGKPRGYALLSFSAPTVLPSSPSPTIQRAKPLSHEEVMKTNTRTTHSIKRSSSGQLQSMSIMFRITMNQNVKRRQYKRYLETLMPTMNNRCEDRPHRITLEKVSSYFKCQNQLQNDGQKIVDEDPIKVWEIVGPIRVTDDVGKSMVSQMRTFLRDLNVDINCIIDGNKTNGKNSGDGNHALTVPAADTDQRECRKASCCGKTDSHQYCVSPKEAVLLVYLAALPETERRDIVMNVKSNVSNVIREQLLIEADMIDSAVEMSDEYTSFES